MEKWKNYNWHSIFASIHHMATVLALIIGGWWTYTNFIAGRAHIPRVQVDTATKVIELSLEYTLLHSEARLQNIGTRRVKLTEFNICMQYVKPLMGDNDDYVRAFAHRQHDHSYTTIPFSPNTSKCRTLNENIILEPGEEDSLFYDFVLDQPVLDVLFIEIRVKTPDNYEVDSVWRDIEYVNVSSQPFKESKHDQS